MAVALTVSMVDDMLTCCCSQPVYREPQPWRWLSLCLWWTIYKRFFFTACLLGALAMAVAFPVSMVDDMLTLCFFTACLFGRGYAVTLLYKKIVRGCAVTSCQYIV